MITSFEEIYRYLPARLTERVKLSLSDNFPTQKGEFITELRLRRDRQASVTLSSGRNIPLPVACSRSELACVIARLTENSMHSHTVTIKKGYIKLPDGCRVGLCGKAVCERERDGDMLITNIGEITSLNIRIAYRISGTSDGIYDTLKRTNFAGGALFYGPPCSGKTTLLRDIAIRASSGTLPMRVAVIDSRGEFRDDEAMSGTLIDLLDGYPKAEGIEQATRTLSPELIICDEIGGADEARAILAAQNSGVPLIASAHAGNMNELLRRTPVKMLYENGVFMKYIGITRDESAQGGLKFNINDINNPSKTVLQTV